MRDTRPSHRCFPKAEGTFEWAGVTRVNAAISLGLAMDQTHGPAGGLSVARTAPSERLCRRATSIKTESEEDDLAWRTLLAAKSAGDREYQDRGAVVLESPTPPSLCLYYVFFIFFLFFIFYVYFAFLPTRGR